MTIETKFNVGDTVFFIYNGKYRKGTVIQINIHTNKCSGTYIIYKVRNDYDTFRLDIFRCKEQELSSTLEEAIQAQEEAERELEEYRHRVMTER